MNRGFRSPGFACGFFRRFAIAQNFCKKNATVQLTAIGTLGTNGAMNLVTGDDHPDKMRVIVRDAHGGRSKSMTVNGRGLSPDSVLKLIRASLRKRKKKAS